MQTVTGVSKRFGPNLVLDNVSFSVREGEILGLIGPNGAGKTTLFECMAGLIRPDAGSVNPPGRGTVFYLPDAIRPWSVQTVGWTLRFFAGLHGVECKVPEELQLSVLSASTIGSLSKGECKRLLLALALLTPHPLLLLDEPFDGLDFRQTRDAMRLLQAIPATGRTLFLSIHQLGDAERICDRLLLLSRGRIVGQGTLHELRAKAGLWEGGLEEVFLALT